jgi:hypothetical protein
VSTIVFEAKTEQDQMSNHKNNHDDDDFSDHGGRDRDDDHGVKGHDGNDDNFVRSYGTVDTAAQDPSHTGQMYFGNGNLATGYNLADNTKEHLEIGLKVHERGSGVDQTPAFDSKGEAIYIENAGLQTSTRANWNFDYSIDTLLKGKTDGNLDHFQFKITVDNGTHHETFDLNAATHQFVSETDPLHHAFGGDDFNHPATANVMAHVAENSVNIGFGAFDGFGTIEQRTAAGQHYEVTLQALEHHEVVAAVHDFVIVV